LTIEEGAVARAIVAAVVRASSNKDSSSRAQFETVIATAIHTAAEGKTLQELLGIDTDDVVQISKALTDAVLNIVETRTPALVEAFDITSMVSERIDSLDMREVERIVLGVVSKELAWITWIGGILGFLIGIVQSIISIL